MKELSKYFKEKHFFWLIILLNLIPLFQGKFFPSIDGPAHIHNSVIILELFSGNEFFENHFSLNSFWIPNWSGHFLLTFFNSFLPAYIAEKIVLLLYFIGLPLAFRSFLKTIQPEGNAYLFSYLIFPFSFNFMILMGFYNFSLALVLFLVSLTYFIRVRQVLQAKHLIVLALLILATYYSHLFMFGLLLICIALIFGSDLIKEILKEKDQWKSILKKQLIKGLKLATTAVLPLILLFIYFSKAVESPENYVEFRQLVDWLKYLKPLFLYEDGPESANVKKLIYVFGILVSIAGFIRIEKIKIDKTQGLKEQTRSFIQSLFQWSDIWLFPIFLCFYLYFTLPDAFNGAGLISVRIGFMIFFFLLIWLAQQRFPKWLIWSCVLAVLILNFRINAHYNEIGKELNKTVDGIYELSDHIEANKTLMPINRTGNWLMGHYSNYLGAEKALVILENYEATTWYFPVKWNFDVLPNMTIGSHICYEYPCLYWPDGAPEHKKEVIDYIFIHGRLNLADSCDMFIQKSLDESYALLAENEIGSLYELKR